MPPYDRCPISSFLWKIEHEGTWLLWLLSSGAQASIASYLFEEFASCELRYVFLTSLPHHIQFFNVLGRVCWNCYLSILPVSLCPFPNFESSLQPIPHYTRFFFRLLMPVLTWVHFCYYPFFKIFFVGLIMGQIIV